MSRKNRQHIPMNPPLRSRWMPSRLRSAVRGVFGLALLPVLLASGSALAFAQAGATADEPSGADPTPILRHALAATAFAGDLAAYSREHVAYARVPADSLFHPMFDFGFNLKLGLPQGSFKSNVGTVGFGIDFIGLYHFRRLPFAVGLDMGILIYGSQTRNEPLSTTIPDVTVNVTNTNNYANFHLVGRVQPQAGSFRPYADLLLGMNYLFTDTRINDQDDYDEVASSTNFSDTAFSTGLAVGMKWYLSTGEEEVTGVPFQILLDTKLKYLFGREAEYLKKGSMRVEDGQLFFDTMRSRTDLLGVQVGIVVEF